MASVAELHTIGRFSLLSDDDLLESYWWGKGEVTMEELERESLQRTALKVINWEAVSEFLKRCTTFPTGLFLSCKGMSEGEVEMKFGTLLKVVAENSAAAAAFQLLNLDNLSTSENAAVVAKYLLHPTTQTHLRHLWLYNCSQEAWAHLEATLRNPQCPLIALRLGFVNRRGFRIPNVQRMPNLTSLWCPYNGDESPEFELDNLGRLSKLILRVYGPEQLPAPLLDALESPQCRLQTLCLWNYANGEDLSISSSVLRLAQALQSPHNSVRELALFDFPLLSMSEVVVHLHNASQNPHCKIQALHLSFGEMFSHAIIGKKETKLIAEMLESRLLGLELNNVELSGVAMERLSQALCKSKLHTLMLRYCKMTDEAVAFLADALRGKDNPHFTFLDLLWTGLPSREAKMLLIDALEMNFHVTKLVVKWEDGGLEARCAALLERNEQMLKGALLQQNFGPPKTGRLFICGNQEVGKTTLRRGLSKACHRRHSNNSPFLLQGSSCTPLLFPCSPGEARTRGIELETLQFEGGKQLVVYDLAGQREYHSFHHFFVTGATQDLFILVCKYDQDQAILDGQLKYWFKFICSHCSSRASSNDDNYKPKVMLVLNFFPPDHFQNDTAYMRRVADDRTQKLREEFKMVLNFKPKIFGINAKTASHLVPIAKEIESLLDKLLGSRQIPQLCNEIASLLADMPPRTCNYPFQNRRSKPIFRGYFEVVEEHRKMFLVPDSTIPTSDEAFEAALRELHQEGKIVYFHIQGEEPKNQIIIADCGWFCHVFMGALFEPEYLRTHRSRSNSRQAWVWRVEEVKDILRKKEQNCEEEQLEKVILYLEKLELLYFINQHEDKEVLVPSLLSPTNTLHQWPNASSSDDHHVYFGRRLCCKDAEKTLMPSGVFSRLQVKLHDIFGARSNQSFEVGDGWILFSENNINVAIMHGGPEDQWEERQWIDIMVRRKKEEDKEAVAERIVKKIIGELFQIHSGTRALGGVELEEKVMSHLVVKALNAKSNHVLSLSQIKSDVLDNGYQYDFTWPDHSVTPILQLLWSSEVTRIFKQHADAVKSIAEEFNVVVEEACKMEEELPSLGLGSGTMEEQFKALLKWLERKFQWLDERNEERHRQLQQQIAKSLEKAERRILSSCSNQLVRDLLETPLPALPYLTDEVGHFQKLKHFLLPGKNVGRLHFLCESPHPHPIEGQEGVPITILPEWLISVTPFLVPFLKVLCFISQLGINIYFPAFSSMLPSPKMLSSLLGLDSQAIRGKVLSVALGNYVEGVDSKLLKNLQSGQHIQPRERELQQCLRQILNNEKIDMARDFKLYKVHFNRGDGQGGISWVCADHASEGDYEFPNSNPFAT